MDETFVHLIVVRFAYDVSVMFWEQELIVDVIFFIDYWNKLL